MCLVASCLALGDAAGAQAGHDPKADRIAKPIRELLRQPFAALGEGGVIRIDYSQDPNAAFRAMRKTEDQVNDVTFAMKGVKVMTPAERKALGQRLTQGLPPVSPPKCPDLPTGERSTDGSTKAYLGCDPTTGALAWGGTYSGPFTESFEGALREVVTVAAPALTDMVSTVEAQGGDITVSLPPAFVEQVSALPQDSRLELKKRLVFTAYTNGLISSVSFNVEGDCLAFALAVGGDICSTTNLTGW